MKMQKMCVVVFCVMLMGSFTSAGIVSIDTTAPTANVITSDAETAASYTRIFDVDNNANHVRGNTFVTGDNGGASWEMSSLTIRKAGLQTFNNDTLKLWIAECTLAEWNAGDGEGDGDFFDETGATVLVDGESFIVDGAIAGNSYVSLNLASSITLNENTNYVWVLTYEESEASSPNYFQLREDNNSASETKQLRINATTNTNRTGWAMTYYVNAVPEPATMTLLGLGSLMMLKRRRKA